MVGRSVISGDQPRERVGLLTQGRNKLGKVGGAIVGRKQQHDLLFLHGRQIRIRPQLPVWLRRHTPSSDYQRVMLHAALRSANSVDLVARMALTRDLQRSK